VGEDVNKTAELELFGKLLNQYISMLLHYNKTIHMPVSKSNQDQDLDIWFQYIVENSFCVVSSSAKRKFRRDAHARMEFHDKYFQNVQLPCAPKKINLRVPECFGTISTNTT
jgi:hypothetical protein